MDTLEGKKDKTKMRTEINCCKKFNYFYSITLSPLWILTQIPRCECHIYCKSMQYVYCSYSTATHPHPSKCFQVEQLPKSLFEKSNF